MSPRPSDIKNLILKYIKAHPDCSSMEILAGLGIGKSPTTIKRYLQELDQAGFVLPSGKNKGRRYSISPNYDLQRPVDVEQYFEQEIDERDIQATYNHSLVRKTLHRADLFTAAELDFLEAQQAIFKANTAKLTSQEFRDEMERLAIDLSWKSSQIEGNTYSLLETERLLRHRETASGKTKDEATMLLNHKAALDFILYEPGYIDPLTVPVIEDIHSMLVKDLGIPKTVRKRRVGISGTNYRPLDNEFQIREALADLCVLVNGKQNVFEKALLALVLIAYIQPFSDGNKRTGRIISNAILIRHDHCPISFRTIDSVEYKKAMLIFYEQTGIAPFKKIFMDQFAFAVRTYF